MMNDDRQTLRQIRSVATNFQTRSEDSGPVIAGYFAVFDSDYELWPGATERVAPGAFSKCLNDDIRALADHDTRLVLGRTTAGTLSLREDEHGLYGEIKINEHDSDAMNLYARVQRGDVTQCSFGFDIVREHFNEAPGGACCWTIREVKLYEVSVCTFPAYKETEVTARTRDRAEVQKRQMEIWKKTMKEKLKKCSK